MSVKALAEAYQVRDAVFLVPSEVAMLLAAATPTSSLPAAVRVSLLSRDTSTALSEVVKMGTTVTPEGRVEATVMA